MATNFYFQSGVPMGKRSESLLMEDLIIECLKIYGFDCYYIPRVEVDRDNILNEDVLQKFESSFPIETYLENTTGFGGTDLLTKFGVEIQDTATFIIARRRWEELVGRKELIGKNIVTALKRPAEGDLLYFPLTKSFFEIRYVEVKDPFFQVGKLYVYRLECELFQYSHEEISTAIKDIDEVAAQISQDVLNYKLTFENGYDFMLESENGDHLILEEYSTDARDGQAQNEAFETDVGDILDFTDRNPFGEVYNR